MSAPKWLAHAKARIAESRFTVGSDLHLLEMAVSDYEAVKQSPAECTCEAKDMPFGRCCKAHTPGPWDASDANAVWAISPWNARVCIANVTEFSPMNGINSAANARLIAAAPELLAALIAMESEKADYMQRNHLGDPAKERTTKMAREAIAKATP